MSKKAGGGGGGGAKRPPIFDAIEDEDVAAVKPMIAASLEQKNKDGFTPLLYASYVGVLEIVDALLEAGANVRATCKDGDTALHYASAQGHLEVIARLGRQKGVALECTDADGETPMDVAANGKVKKLLQKLIELREEEGNDEGVDEGGEGEEEGEEGEAEEQQGGGGSGKS